MDMSDAIHQDERHPFTFVADHLTEETNKNIYHLDVDESFSDEGHYHLKKKIMEILRQPN